MEINALLPQKFRALLEKKLTPEQLDIGICEVACEIPECIDDFRWKPLPTPTPEYKKWRFMSEKEKEDFKTNQRSFYEKNIIGFGDDTSRIEHLNDRNFFQLKAWLKLKITPFARKKVEEMLDTYSGR